MREFLGRKRVRLGALIAAVVMSAGIFGVATAAADDPPPPGDVAPQIIGGGAASDDYSWMASLAFIDGAAIDTGHRCGGSLVTRKWVVTAAHCVADPPTGLTVDEQDKLSDTYRMDLYDHLPSEGSFYVRVGDHDRTAGVVANVSKVVIHQDFTWFAPGKANDVAMLLLDKQLDQQPIQLASDAADPDGAIRLLGWGITEPDGTGTDPIILQELDTTVAQDGECIFGIPGDLTEGEICVANANGTDGPCYGDSGGPGIERGADGRWKLIGIASRGPRYCGTGTAIYGSPPDFRKWIYDTARGVAVPAPVKVPTTGEPTYTLPFEPPVP